MDKEKFAEKPIYDQIKIKEMDLIQWLMTFKDRDQFKFHRTVSGAIFLQHIDTNTIYFLMENFDKTREGSE